MYFRINSLTVSVKHLRLVFDIFFFVSVINRCKDNKQRYDCHKPIFTSSRVLFLLAVTSSV